ncbi:MAG: hypothetical protein NTY38_20430 [Acidobacteria bacterium]|nr:hypothetical protein [Acidobacteriota bacterium]
MAYGRITAQERRALLMETVRAEGDRIEARLDWPLDPAVFDLPLTILADVPLTWTAARAELDGRAVAVKLVPGGKSNSLEVEVPSRTKLLVLRPAGID